MRASVTSSSARRFGAAWDSRSAGRQLSAAASWLIVESFGSRWPFSSCDRYDGDRPIAWPSASSVVPACLRRYRNRWPNMSGSSDPDDIPSESFAVLSQKRKDA
jgi:hypothetical protein